MRKHRIWMDIIFIIFTGFGAPLSAQNVDENFMSQSQSEADFKYFKESDKDSRILFLPGKPQYSFYERGHLVNLIKSQDEKLNENPQVTPSTWDRNKIHIKFLTGPSGIGKTATIWQFIEKHGNNYSNIVWFDGSSQNSIFKSMQALVVKMKSDTKSMSQEKNEIANDEDGNEEELDEEIEFLEIRNLAEEIYDKVCSKKSMIIFDNLNVPMEQLMHFLPLNDQVIPSKSYELPLIVMTTSREMQYLLSVTLLPNPNQNPSGNQFENQNQHQDDAVETEDDENHTTHYYRYSNFVWDSQIDGFPQFGFHIFPINPFVFEETFQFVFNEFLRYNKIPTVQSEEKGNHGIIKDVQDLNELLGGFPLALQQAVSYLNEENDLIRDGEQQNDVKLLTIRDYINLIHAHSNSRPYLHDHPIWTTTMITLRLFKERALHSPVYKLSVQILEGVAILHPGVHGTVFGHALTFSDKNQPTPLPRIIPQQVPSYANDSFNLLALYAIVEYLPPSDLNSPSNPLYLPVAGSIRWEGPARLSCIFDGKNSQEISNLFYFIIEPLDEISTSIIFPLEKVKNFRKENQDLMNEAFLHIKQYLVAMETMMGKIWLAKGTPSYPHFLKYILKFSAYFCHIGKGQVAKPWIFHFFSLLKTHIDEDDKKNFSSNQLESLFHFNDYKLPDKQKSLNFHRLVSEGAHHVFEGAGQNQNHEYDQVIAFTLENVAEAQIQSKNGEIADDDDLSQALFLFRQAYQMTKSGGTLNKMANALLDQKKYKEAKRLFFDEIYEQETLVYGEGHPKSLLPLYSLAKTYSARGNHQMALEILFEIQQAVTKYQDENESSLELELFSLSILHSVADAYFNSGRADLALKMYEQVHSARKKIQGEEHPDTLVIANDLAQCYRALGRNIEANMLLLNLVKIKSKDLGVGHEDSYNKFLDLADVFVKEGQWEQASSSYHIIHTSRELRLGENHMETLEALEKLGTAELGAEKWEKSIETLEKVLNSRKSQISKSNTPDANSFSLISPLPALVYANFLQGQNVLAKGWLEEFQKKMKEIQTIPGNDQFLLLLTAALHHAKSGRQKQVLKALSPLYDIQKEVCGRSHPQTISFLRHFALIYLSQKNNTKALHLSKLCVKLARGHTEDHPKGSKFQIQSQGKDHQPPLNPQLIPSLEALALVYEAQKDSQSSLQIYLEISQLQGKSGQSLDRVVIMEKLTDSLYDQQQYALAHRYYTEIYRLRKESNGPTHSLTLRAQMRQTSSLVQIHPNAQTILSYKDTYELWKGIYSEEHPILIEILEVIAKLETQTGDWEEALKTYEKLHKIQSKISGGGTVDALQCLLKMVQIYEKQEKYHQALDLVKQAIGIQKKTRGSINDQQIHEAQEIKKRLERAINTRKRVQQALKDEL